MGLLSWPPRPPPLHALTPACHCHHVTLTPPPPSYTPTKPQTKPHTIPHPIHPQRVPQGPRDGPQRDTHHDVLRPTPQRKTDRSAAHPPQWRRASEHQPERGPPRQALRRVLGEVELAFDKRSAVDKRIHKVGGEATDSTV
jgi:hypothetical protein